MKEPRRCQTHMNPRDWLDAKPEKGMVRTTCAKCGAFIGYRPAVRDKQATKALEESA